MRNWLCIVTHVNFYVIVGSTWIQWWTRPHGRQRNTGKRYVTMAVIHHNNIILSSKLWLILLLLIYTGKIWQTRLWWTRWLPRISSMYMYIYMYHVINMALCLKGKLLVSFFVLIFWCVGAVRCTRTKRTQRNNWRASMLQIYIYIYIFCMKIL